MGDPPEARLDAPQDDRFGRFEIAADQVGVGDHGPVGAAAVDPPGREVVLPAPLSRGGAVGDHRVDAAARHAPEEGRFAEAGDVRPRGDVRLGDDPHAVPRPEEPLSDDGDADVGAVDVAVPGDQDHVEPIPAERPEFFRRGG